MRNWRAGRGRSIDFRHPTAPVDVRVREAALNRELEQLPLAVLASALFLDAGRKRGITTDLHSLQRVDIGEHEGVAIIGQRSNGVATRRLAQIFLRAERRLFVVSYIAPAAEYNANAAAFARSLAGFKVSLPANPPEIALPTPPPG